MIGQGTNAKLDKQEVQNAAEIKLFEDAMQDATISSQPHTDEGPLYKLEVIYDDNSKETFQHLIRLINDEKLRFMMVDSHYDLLNVKEAIEAVESTKKKNGKVFLTSY